MQPLLSASLLLALFLGLAHGMSPFSNGMRVLVKSTLWKLPPAFTAGTTTFVDKSGNVSIGRLTMVNPNLTEPEGAYSFDDYTSKIYNVGNFTLDRYYSISASGNSYQCKSNFTFAFLHSGMLCGMDNPFASVTNHGYQYLVTSFRPTPNPPRAWGVLYSCIDNEHKTNHYFMNPNTGYPYYLLSTGGFIGGERFVKISFEDVDLLDPSAKYLNFNRPCEKTL